MRALPTLPLDRKRRMLLFCYTHTPTLYFSCSIQLKAQAMATPGSTRPVRGTRTDGAHDGGTKG
jgi:hypothetical protein